MPKFVASSNATDCSTNQDGKKNNLGHSELRLNTSHTMDISLIFNLFTQNEMIGPLQYKCIFDFEAKFVVFDTFGICSTSRLYYLNEMTL